MPTIRAHHIEPAGIHWAIAVVYGELPTKQTKEAICKQLEHSSCVVIELQEPSNRIVIQGYIGFATVIGRIKPIVRPQLSITIRTLGVLIRPCACNRHPPKVTYDYVFLAGLEPDDRSLFTETFEKITFDLPSEPRASSKHFRAALHQTLQDMGVWLYEARIKWAKQVYPCPKDIPGGPMATTRAHHIGFDTALETPIIVYENRLKAEELETILTELNALVGIGASPIPPSNDPLTQIMVCVASTRREVVGHRAIRDIVKPQLAISISMLEITLRHCVCHQHTPKAQFRCRFLPGLGPVRRKDFVAQFEQTAEALLAQLTLTSPQNDTTTYKQNLHLALREMDAWLQVIRIEWLKISYPCPVSPDE